MSNRNQKITVLIILSCVLLIIFYPVLFKNKILLPVDELNTMLLPYSAHYNKISAYNHFLIDALTQYYPYKLLTKINLSLGIPAYWNQYIMGGYPQYAETMAGNFDITNFVLLLFKMPRAYHLQILLQLIIAGFGIYLLLRSFKVSLLIAILFSVAFMLNSLFIRTILHRWILASFCWVPYIILFLRYHSTKESFKYLTIASLFLALAFMGGQFQTSAFACFVVGVFILLNPSANPKAQRLVNKVGTFSFLVTFALLVSAVMWIPTLEMMFHDIRDGGVFGHYVSKPFTLTNAVLSLPLLITFLIPELAGSTRTYDLTKIAHASLAEFNGYFGFIPLLFAIFGMFYLWKKTEVRPFIILMILGIIIPICTPLEKYLYYRFLIVYIFGGIIVGAVAMQETMIDRKYLPSLSRYLVYMTIIILLSFAVFLIIDALIIVKYKYIYSAVHKYIFGKDPRVHFSPAYREWTNGRILKLFSYFSIKSPTIYLPYGLIFSVIILLFYYIKKQSRLQLVLSCLIIITFFHLIFVARSFLPMIDLKTYPLYPETEAISFLQHDTSHFRVYPLFDEEKEPPILPPNILSVYKIRTISGYESTSPRTIFNLIEANHAEKPDWKVLGLANVKYILTNNKMFYSDPEADLVYSKEINIYRNKLWKPWGFMTYKSEVINHDSAVLRIIYSNKFDGTTALLDQKPQVKINSSGNQAKKINYRVHILLSENNLIKLSVDTPEPGYLILSNSYYPGWRATVNGKEEKILKADYAMMALSVPAGTSLIEYRFDPISFKIGLGITLISLILVGLILIISIARGKRAQETYG
jgi:Bacterial membrane protein YfhO